MKTIYDEVAELAFFSGLTDEQRKKVSGCGKTQIFAAGHSIANEGDDADTFYVLRRGRVAVETSVPGGGETTCQTLESGEIFGWSWLFEPYKWNFTAVVKEDTGVIAFNGRCLREKCEHDHELGYVLMKKFSKVMVSRLRAARLQLLDIYGQRSIEEGR